MPGGHTLSTVSIYSTEENATSSKQDMDWLQKRCPMPREQQAEQDAESASRVRLEQHHPQPKRRDLKLLLDEWFMASSVRLRGSAPD